MVRDDEVLFEQDWQNGYLWCKYFSVWEIFKFKFGFNDQKINEMISGILEEEFKKEGTLKANKVSLIASEMWEDQSREETLKPDYCTGLVMNLFEVTLRPITDDASFDHLLENEGILKPCQCIQREIYDWDNMQAKLEKQLKNRKDENI